MLGEGLMALDKIFLKGKKKKKAWCDLILSKGYKSSLVSSFITPWKLLCLGGGFHHCSSDKGGGFCAYADITLAIKVRNTILRVFSTICANGRMFQKFVSANLPHSQKKIYPSRDEYE